MYSFLRVLILFAGLAQLGGSQPVIIGSMGTKLSEADVAKVLQTLGQGKRIWLLRSKPSQGAPRQGGRGLFVYAYLSPEHSDSRLRRGRVEVLNGLKSASGTIEELRSSRSEEYAQVAVEKRQFEVIRGDRDVNLPFFIRGQFDDEELISLIDFIRQNRGNPDTTRAIQGDWPIGTASKSGDGTFRVSLSGRGFEVQSVELLRQNGRWTVIRISNGSA